MYRFPSGIDGEKHARVIAIGQTAGSWSDTVKSRFAHRADALAGHLGQVVNVAAGDNGSQATIRFPRANVEGDIASLLTMIFGKYSMAGAARVVDVRLPADYGTRPAVGLSGLRRRLGVTDRPLVMAIFKPALGLSAADHADILSEVVDAGIEDIKDDEILGNLTSAPTMDRVRACRPVLERARAAGRNVLYAVNLTGPVDQLIDRARALIDAGANAFLFNALAYGYSCLEALARHPDIDVPLFAHPALAGALSAAPDTGLAYSVVLGTLMAHAGADAVLYPAHYGSLPFDPAEERRIADILRGRNVFPVPSAGIHPGVVPKAMADYGHDEVLNAGTGIMDHPGGPGAGVRAFHEALERHAAGEDFATAPPGPLRTALDTWGMP